MLLRSGTQTVVSLRAVRSREELQAPSVVHRAFFESLSPASPPKLVTNAPIDATLDPSQTLIPDDPQVRTRSSVRINRFLVLSHKPLRPAGRALSHRQQPHGGLLQQPAHQSGTRTLHPRVKRCRAAIVSSVGDCMSSFPPCLPRQCTPCVVSRRHPASAGECRSANQCEQRPTASAFAMDQSVMLPSRWGSRRWRMLRGPSA